ncbi:uncharacterized protein METZ01_LOCUS254762, partial [marine metagenome]
MGDWSQVSNEALARTEDAARLYIDRAATASPKLDARRRVYYRARHGKTVSKPGDPMPFIWQHDVMHEDETPYGASEMALIQSFEGKEMR